MPPLAFKYQNSKPAHCLLLSLLMLTLAACDMNKKKLDAGQYFSDAVALEMAQAIENSDTESITALAGKIDIDAQGNQGMTFLLWAMKNKQMPSYKTLLSLGADTESGTDGGTTPLGVAMTEEIQWLIPLVEAGADINLKVGGEPVWFGAYLAQNWKVLDYLLQHDLDLNAQDSIGYTAIMEMAGLGQYEQVLKLIEKGADISLMTKNGNSFAYTAQTSVPVKTHKQYQYYQQVLKHLQGKGIVFPVKGPRELSQQSR